MKGKCNCRKKATSEWMIYSKKCAWIMKWCNDCKPEKESKTVFKI